MRWCYVPMFLYRHVAASVRTGGRLPVAVVLVLGFSNIFADALSMGVGEYLSSKVRPMCSQEAYRYRQYPCEHGRLYSVDIPSFLSSTPTYIDFSFGQTWIAGELPGIGDADYTQMVRTYVYMFSREWTIKRMSHTYRIWFRLTTNTSWRRRDGKSGSSRTTGKEKSWRWSRFSRCVVASSWQVKRTGDACSRDG